MKTYLRWCWGDYCSLATWRDQGGISFEGTDLKMQFYSSKVSGLSAGGEKMLIQNSKEQPGAQREQTKPKVRIHKKHHPEKKKIVCCGRLESTQGCVFSVFHELCLKLRGEKHHLQIPWIQLRLSVGMTLRRSVASASQSKGRFSKHNLYSSQPRFCLVKKGITKNGKDTAKWYLTSPLT